MKEVKVSSNGVSFFGLLAIVFIALKLMNYINWSWWYVLMPLYLPVAIVLIIFIIALLILFIKYLFEK